MRTPLGSKLFTRTTFIRKFPVNAIRIRQNGRRHNNRIIILQELRSAGKNIFILMIKYPERQEIERCCQWRVKVHKRSKLHHFKFEFCFFRQLVRFWRNRRHVTYNLKQSVSGIWGISRWIGKYCLAHLQLVRMSVYIVEPLDTAHSKSLPFCTVLFLDLHILYCRSPTTANGFPNSRFRYIQEYIGISIIKRGLLITTRPHDTHDSQ